MNFLSNTIEQKKVQEVKGSYYIYLPHDWCIHYEINKQKKVYMKRLEDDTLLIQADTKSNFLDTQFEIDLDSDPKFTEEISDELYEDYLFNQYLTAYIIGYNTIQFNKRSNISLKIRSRIRKMTQHFNGMMVVNESETMIKVENTSPSVDIRQLVRQILTKVGLLMNNYIDIVDRDAGNELDELMAQDDQIDEHRYAIERQVHRILRYPTLALDNQTNAIQCLHYSECAKIIERIGDHITILSNLYREEPIHDKQFVLHLLRDMYRYYCNIQDYFERDDSLKFFVITDDARKFAEENKAFVTSTNPDKSYVGQIRRVYALISDIAEIRINEILSRKFIESSNPSTN
jgi:phosphate uptake regulator